jgi:hypothetical protein
MNKVEEICIDAAYNTSATSTHLYAILAAETGWFVPIGFMLMHVRKTENSRRGPNRQKEVQCNQNFFAKAKELGMEPTFIHTDKDFGEISPAQVRHVTPNPLTIGCLARCTHKYVFVACSQSNQGPSR